MKIVIIGGSGLIGTKHVSLLQDQGHDPVAASPNAGVNTVTGEGLTEALVHGLPGRPARDHTDTHQDLLGTDLLAFVNS